MIPDERAHKILQKICFDIQFCFFTLFMSLFQNPRYSFQIVGFRIKLLIVTVNKGAKLETDVILKSSYYCFIRNHKRSFCWNK